MPGQGSRIGQPSCSSVACPANKSSRPVAAHECQRRRGSRRTLRSESGHPASRPLASEHRECPTSGNRHTSIPHNIAARRAPAPLRRSRRVAAGGRTPNRPTGAVTTKPDEGHQSPVPRRTKEARQPARPEKRILLGPPPPCPTRRGRRGYPRSQGRCGPAPAPPRR